MVDEPAALVWAANFGALEWHAWTSLTDRPHQPGYALIDIDPGESTSWQDVLVLAELDDPGLRPDGFNIQTVPQRIAECGDEFRPLLAARQSLPPLG